SRSDGVGAPARIRAPLVIRLWATTISMVLASHTVQVTIDAKASPIRTAFTTGSALRYMPHGERSRGRVALPISGASPASCASADKGRAENPRIMITRRTNDAGRLCQSCLQNFEVHMELPPTRPFVRLNARRQRERAKTDSSTNRPIDQ